MRSYSRSSGAGVRECDVHPSFLYELGAEGARKVREDVQTAPIDKLDIAEK